MHENASMGEQSTERGWHGSDSFAPSGNGKSSNPWVVKRLVRAAGAILASYGFFGMLDMAFCVLTTKLRFPNARLVRRPAYIRGKRWIRVGAGFTTGRALRMEAFPAGRSSRIRIDIGHHVQLNDNVHIAAVDRVQIGNHVLIASKVFISDHNHGAYSGAGQQSPLVPPAERVLDARPVSIEDNVWIGEFVSVLPGVRIGQGSVIGTMSVVTRDIPPFSIAVGSPARVIKQFNFATNCWERV
jgi:lipopolysaccharide O-acetyltransferase